MYTYICIYLHLYKLAMKRTVNHSAQCAGQSYILSFSSIKSKFKENVLRFW